MSEKLKLWWNQDAFRRWLLVGGFVYALFFAQGIPLWDDDFTSWFRGQSTNAPPLNDVSIFKLLWQWIWPVSSSSWGWGFNDRPLEMIWYKVFHAISGYEAWSYFLVKSAVFAGLGVMIYTWALRLVPKSDSGRRAAFAGALFFMLAPGPMAAHILHQDFAPVAELLFLAITYVIWDEVEKTPADWKGLPKLSDPAQKKWVLRWLGLSFVTYLAYKSKADLKVIPVILASYVALVRRRQLGFFAVPVAAMLLLAVPWGPGIFSKLPPFIPGSHGAEQGWMWQPASIERLRDFIWNSGGYSFMDSMKASTISLAGLLGPFLLIGIVVFLGWRMDAIDKVPWRRLEEPSDRARTFMLLWFLVILGATSALPAINYIFRIRYGILTMVPTSILLAWVFGLFSDSASKLPKWAAAAGIALFAIQAGINLNRSIVYRRDMGQVMVSVDQVYEHVNKKFPNEKLVLMPDFRSYDYRPDAGPAISQRETLANADDLPKKYQPFKTYTISWKPSLWEQVEMVEYFSGCRETTVFDRIFKCPSGTGTFLARYIGADPLYTQGEQLRAKGDIAGARKKHEEFIAKYPLSMAGYFVLGLESYQLKDWVRSDQAYGMLEKYFPDHLSILYNRALALAELKQYDAAIERLKYIIAREPQNYAALINLYWAQVKDGQDKRAKDTLVNMKRMFPNDGEVNRLISSQKS